MQIKLLVDVTNRLGTLGDPDTVILKKGTVINVLEMDINDYVIEMKDKYNRTHERIIYSEYAKAI